MTGYDITQWASKQQPWLQEAMIRFHVKKKLDDSDIIDLVFILKGQKPVTPNLSLLNTSVSVENSIRLISISNPIGIDRLRPRNPLCLGTGQLAVIYGLNGSGKSGYARIIKKFCGKTTELLKSDAYNTTSKEQSCSITYSIDAVEKNIIWNASDAGVSELNAVDVFDSDVGTNYLNNENEAAYVPYEMSLFTALSDACDRVNAALEREKYMLTSQLPKLPSEYDSTNIANMYVNLSDKVVSELVKFDNEDIAKLKNLKERLSTQDPNASAKKLRGIIKQIDDIKALLTSIQKITVQDFIAEFEKLFVNATQKREEANAGIRVIESETELEGVGSEIWKALWESARNYSNLLAYKGKDYPCVENKALCVLCQQELNVDAKERFQHFETFIKGKLESDAVFAENELKKAIQNLPQLVIESNIKTMLQAAEIQDELSIRTWDWLSMTNTLISHYIEKNITAIKELTISDVACIVEQFNNISSEAEAKALQFEEDSKSFDRTKTQSDVRELEARQWTAQQNEAINAELKRKKALAQYEQWLKLTNTRIITTEAGKASEILLTHAYIERFNTELQKFGASRITVKLENTKNVKGRGKYRVLLRDAEQGFPPSDILSEGEKRVVSLAAFLADTNGKSGNVPFIFDDPISSLDQEYEERTIARLVELAKERQVIIFTHRLSFLSILTDSAKKAAMPLETIHLFHEVWGAGEPVNKQITESKPLKALNALKTRIAQAKKIQNEQGAEAYSVQSQSICSDFRKFVERIVEVNLLNEIVLRHRRSITTQGRLQSLSKINANDCSLIDAMMTKYSTHEHSQSFESSAQLPLPQELEDDIDTLITWINEFSNRAS